MLVSKKLVIFALVVALAYAKRKGKGGNKGKGSTTTAPPPSPSTTHVPGGIEFFMKLYYRLDISLFKKGKYDFDHLIHYSEANEGPQDQATQYVPGQPGIELFVE